MNTLYADIFKAYKRTYKHPKTNKKVSFDHVFAEDHSKFPVTDMHELVKGLKVIGVETKDIAKIKNSYKALNSGLITPSEYECIESVETSLEVVQALSVGFPKLYRDFIVNGAAHRGLLRRVDIRAIRKAAVSGVIFPDNVKVTKAMIELFDTPLGRFELKDMLVKFFGAEKTKRNANKVFHPDRLNHPMATEITQLINSVLK